MERGWHSFIRNISELHSSSICGIGTTQMRLRSLFTFVFGACLSGLSHGITICALNCDSGIVGSGPQPVIVGDPAPEPINGNLVSVDGNLYLDFSLWGNVGGIDASQGSSYSFDSPEIVILSEAQEPPDVLNFEVVFIEGSTAPLELVGNFVLFSDSFIASTSFTASKSLYVGDFSKYSAVPTPAAIWFFGSGLLGLVGVARKRAHFRRT